MLGWIYVLRCWIWLMLHQNLVVTVGNLCSVEGKIQRSMGQMHFAGRQVSVVLRSANVQWFTGRSRSSTHSIMRHWSTMSRMYPRIIASNKYLEIMFEVLSSTVRHVRSITRYFCGYIFTLVKSTAYVQWGSINVTSGSYCSKWNWRAAGTTLPATFVGNRH